MRSLDEMRPKIVELTDEKLALSEKIDGLEKTIGARDNVIAQLESSLEELREEKVSVERDRDGLRSTLEGERSALQKDSTELQQAYSELQSELTAAQRKAQDLEDERDKLRLVANSNVEEIRRLTDNLRLQTTQLDTLRAEIEERTEAQAESSEFLERAQTEMEAFRGELAQRDDMLVISKPGNQLLACTSCITFHINVYYLSPCTIGRRHSHRHCPHSTRYT